ncbi:hypothetical protein K0M31_007211 [Melipona bicolor]|uniref:Uncharacterized protein n=1 Tax=Melipona bicolor TaxID=60889 RepID=A0AA40GB09_9HYME|nr:hypothetical protein K0M31_007211 [Melipona bicolor]
MFSVKVRLKKETEREQPTSSTRKFRERSAIVSKSAQQNLLTIPRQTCSSSQLLRVPSAPYVRETRQSRSETSRNGSGEAGAAETEGKERQESGLKERSGCDRTRI